MTASASRSVTCWRAIPSGASTTSSVPGTPTTRGSPTLGGTRNRSVPAKSFPRPRVRLRSSVLPSIRFSVHRHRSCPLERRPVRLGMLCLGSRNPGFFEDGGFGSFKVTARPLAAALLEGCIRSTRDELIRAWRINRKELVLLDLQRKGMSTKADRGQPRRVSARGQFLLPATQQEARRPEAGRRPPALPPSTG